MSSSTRQSVSPSGARRPWILIAGCVLAAVAIALLIQRATVTNRTNDRLAALKESGIPVNLDGLNRFYAIPAGATNAADFYMPAFDSLVGKHHSNTNAPIYNKVNLGDPYPANSIAFMRKWITDNKSVLKLLQQGAQHPTCRYPLDYNEAPEIPKPHQADHKQCVLLLSYDAWLRAESNDLDGAINSLETAMSLSDSLTNEPDWIGKLLRIAGHAIVIARLEEIMNRHRFNEPQLNRLRRLIEGRESPGTLRPAFASSLCYGLNFLEDPFPIDDKGNRTTLTRGESAKASLTQAMNIFTSFRERDRDFYVDVMARCIDATDKPFPAALREVESVEAVSSVRSGKSNRPGALILRHSLSDMVVREARRIAMLRVAQTAIAIQRYRLVHDDALPDSLKELVPKFLSEIPADPFDGKPLRYSPLNPGYIIYSISRDMQDDRGDPSPVGNKKDDHFRMFR